MNYPGLGTCSATIEHQPPLMWPIVERCNWPLEYRETPHGTAAHCPLHGMQLPVVRGN